MHTDTIYSLKCHSTVDKFHFGRSHFYQNIVNSLLFAIYNFSCLKNRRLTCMTNLDKNLLFFAKQVHV